MRTPVRWGLAFVAWGAIVGGAWIAFVPDFASPGSLTAVALSVTLLLFGALVVHRAHLPEPSIRQVRAEADVAAAARASIFARLK